MRHTYSRIPKPMDAQEYFEKALSKGRTAASRVKRIQDQLILKKAKERDRMTAIADTLISNIEGLIKAYPDIGGMSEFMRQLFAQDMEPAKAQRALAGLDGLSRTIRGLVTNHRARVTRAHTEEDITRATRSFLGRLGSVITMMRPHLEILTQARAILRDLPLLDEELYTVAIAGFPNVGKSTLLSKLTDAKPEIKPYAFTTKGLNAGYFEHRFQQIQLVDTPGTLDREKANPIERKAEIAMRYLAELIVFVVDPTEASYPLEQQEALLERTEVHGVPIVVYISKTDIAPKATVARIRAKHPDALTDPEKVRKAIVDGFKKRD